MNDHYYTRHILPDLDNPKMQRMAATLPTVPTHPSVHGYTCIVCIDYGK